MAEIPPQPEWLTSFQQKRKPGFQPGFSGNSRGRVRGSRNKRSLIAEEFEKAGSEVARVVVEKAKAGDLRAAELLLQRIEPPLKPQAPRVTFTIDPDLPIAEQSKALLVACAEGDISPEQFRLLMDCLSAYIGMKDVEGFLDELRSLRESKRPPIPGGVLVTP